MDSAASVKLTVMRESDLELLMAWRSHPDIYRYFKQQDKPLVWEEHLKFWNNRRNREDFVIEFLQNKKWRKVGSANISKLDTEYPEIGILIGEITLQGKRIGSQAVALALKELNSRGHSKASVSVHDDNTPSKKLFTHFGFEKVKADNSDAWKEYRLESFS